MAKKIGKVITRSEMQSDHEKFGSDSLLVKPSESYLRALRASGSHGGCRHFNLEAGQKAIKEERFVERMLREEKYRAEWFEDWRLYGFCDLWEGRLLLANVPAVCMADDVNSSLKGTPAGQKTVPCPYYEDRKGKGDKLIMSRSGKRTLEY